LEILQKANSKLFFGPVKVVCV